MNFFIQTSLKFVPRDPIDSEPVLVQEMFRQGTDDKTLSEAMLTQIADAYMWH